MGDVIKQILARPVQLADLVIKAAEEAASFKQECLELKSKTSKLSDLLRQAARSSAELYERPARRILDDTEQVLEKALSLAQKCQANGLLKRAFTIIPATAFRKMFAQLESSAGDISWLLRASGTAGDDDISGGYLGMPPIASNEPNLGLIWEQIAIVWVGPVDERADAAAALVSMARENPRNGKMILEEGGVGPLSKLLKEGKTVEGQENAARALGLLGRDPENVEHMVHAGVCSVLEKVLKDGPMKVQAMVAWAVSEMAAHYPKCQEIFAQHNVIRLLVGHLAFETVQEHSKYVIPNKTASVSNMGALVAMAKAGGGGGGAGTVAGFVDEDEQAQIAHPMGKRGALHNVVASVQAQAHAKVKSSDPGQLPPQPQLQSNLSGSGNGKLGPGHHPSLAGSKARERELEDPRVKASMKAMSARALWHLARGNSAICRKICESRALLCFAVLLDKGAEEVQHNSAMALMEITAVAEKDSELRRSTFKPNSPACKAVVDQLVKIIEKADSDLLVPCVKAIGNLARTFKATETRMIGPLVHLLDERETEVSREAAIALTKFAGTENYLHVDHSKAIIADGGIKHLVQLVYFGEQRVQIPALVLLSYIALNVPDSEELAKCEALTVLDWASKQSHLVQDETRETLLLETKSRLELYQSRVSR